MVYTPQRGFAQFQYFDQQATALAGMLANASDINLVDSAFVGPVDATVGLTAGIGVMVNPTVRSNRPGLNYDIVMPPDSAATDESFAGIVVRNQFMRTNSNGEACYFFEDMANYARRDRAGARIWVQLAQGSTVFGGPVYWIVRDTKNAGLKIGAFSAAPITGTATPTPGSLNGGTLSVNNVKAVTNGGFDITVASTLHKVAALDFSSVNTVSDVATILQAAITTASVPVTVKAVGNGVVLTTTATGCVCPLSRSRLLLRLRIPRTLRLSLVSLPPPEPLSRRARLAPAKTLCFLPERVSSGRSPQEKLPATTSLSLSFSKEMKNEPEKIQ